MALQRDWHLKSDSKFLFNALLSGSCRRSFGLLETPQIPININYKTNTYKIWFRSGPMQAGKSSTIQKLAGQFISEKCRPTPGVQVTIVYWPAITVNGEKIMFRLELWEAGSSAAARFQNLEQMDEPDAIVLTFSSVDRNTFDALPELITQIKSEVTNEPLMVVISTHADTEVAESEARSFARDNQLQLLRIKNVNTGQRNDETIDGWTSISEYCEMPNRTGGSSGSGSGLTKPVDYVTSVFWGIVNFVVLFFSTMLNIQPPATADQRSGGSRTGGGNGGGGGGPKRFGTVNDFRKKGGPNMPAGGGG